VELEPLPAGDLKLPKERFETVFLGDVDRAPGLPKVPQNLLDVRKGG
jgi:hypothetical protein